MNAFNWQMDVELRAALAELDAIDTVRAIVVTGAGRAFCAGLDLESGGEMFSSESLNERRRLAERLGVLDVRPWELRTPIIAAINGAAVGMGLTLTMQWDIRIAAEDAKLGFLMSRRGLIAEASALWTVPRLVGLSRGLELLITGRLFTGREAAEIGLVSRAVPVGHVLATAHEIARDISENTAPVAVAITKTLVYRFLSENDRAIAQGVERELIRWLGQQPDYLEGIRAFTENRAPKWKMLKNMDFPAAMLSREGSSRDAPDTVR